MSRLEALGVLHPLLVHFPVALLVTALGLELLARRRDRTIPSPHAAPLLVVAALGALLAAATGWLQGIGRTGSPEVLATLERHRWVGLAALGITVAAAVLFRGTPRGGRLASGRACLAVGTLLVLLGGHWGAELTHGRDTYLAALDRVLGRDPDVRRAAERARTARARWAESALEAWSPPVPDAPPTYEKHIQPILVGRCLGCHGAESMKGGLRLDSRARASEGGDLGPAIVPGDPHQSGFWFRCVEDADDQPRMPKGEPPLPAAWIDAIETWIAAGAEWPEPEPTPWLSGR